MHLTQLLLLLTALFGAVNAVSLGAYGKVTVACCFALSFLFAWLFVEMIYYQVQHVKQFKVFRVGRT